MDQSGLITKFASKNSRIQGLEFQVMECINETSIFFSPFNSNINSEGSPSQSLQLNWFISFEDNLWWMKSWMQFNLNIIHKLRQWFLAWSWPNKQSPSIFIILLGSNNLCRVANFNPIVLILFDIFYSLLNFFRIHFFQLFLSFC